MDNALLVQEVNGGGLEGGWTCDNHVTVSEWAQGSNINYYRPGSIFSYKSIGQGSPLLTKT